MEKQHMADDNGPISGLFGFLKGSLVTKGLGFAESLAEVGKYFGLDPKIANGIYAAESVQKLFAGEIDKKETVARVVGAGVNYFTTKKLEDMGVPAPLAALLGDVVSHYTTKFVRGLEASLIKPNDNAGDARRTMDAVDEARTRTGAAGTGVDGGDPSAASRQKTPNMGDLAGSFARSMFSS
jgi:hypothetical protein